MSSRRYEDLMARARAARTMAQIHEVPLSQKLTKKELQVLRVYVDHDGEALTAADVAAALHLRRPPHATISNLAGVHRVLEPAGDDRYRAAFEGVDRLAQHDQVAMFKEQAQLARKGAVYQQVIDANARRRRRIVWFFVKLGAIAVFLTWCLWWAGRNPNP